MTSPDKQIPTEGALADLQPAALGPLTRILKWLARIFVRKPEGETKNDRNNYPLF